MDNGDRAAARTASRQHGLLTLDQARQAGLTYKQVRTRLDTGRWSIVRPCVYRIAGTRQSWHVTILSAVLAAGKGAAVSHATAAHLLGLEGVPAPPQVEVSVPRSRRPRCRDVLIHRPRDLPAHDLHTVDGVPCTNAVRTLLDLAPRLDDSLLTAVTDDAIYGRLASRRTLHERALRADGRSGSDVLVRLTEPGAAAAFRSCLEKEGARVLRVAGLPEPGWNVPVEDRHGRVGVVDACWADQRVIVEWDGLRFHSSDAQRRRDRARDRRLGLARWQVLRYTWLDVRQRPDLVVQQVSEALAVRMAA